MTGPEITIGGGTAGSLILGPRRQEGLAGRLPIRLVANGLDASGVVEAEDWSLGFEGFAAYFGELATDWRGWTGSRDWGDDGGCVDISATHDGVGHVEMRVRLRDLSYDSAGHWMAELVIEVEPGALGRVATDVRRAANLGGHAD